MTRTPGRWRAVECHGGEVYARKLRKDEVTWFIEADTDDPDLHLIVAECSGDKYRHGEADVKLIVAAGNAAAKIEKVGFNGQAAIRALPDLLDACKSALSWLGACQKGTEQAEIADELRSAIVKARGGKQ